MSKLLYITPKPVREDVSRTANTGLMLAGLVPAGLVPAVLAYFGLVFAAGFIFGALRVSLIEPRVGRLVATLIEGPLLILVTVAAARRVISYFELSGHRLALAGVGCLAVSLVFCADFGVGLLLRQMSFGEHWTYLLTPSGLVYLLLLAVFSAMPLLSDLWQRR